MNNIEKVIYTAKTHTVGGREGSAKSNDKKLDITLSTPRSDRKGTNPEQLFAAGWSACYLGAMGLVAKKLGILLPKDVFIDAEVDLGMIGEAYQLQTRFYISLPGIPKDIAEKLTELAHQTCPYSKAIKGNINVSTTLI
ncbi:organic hydroperoxide resistance protein [Sphingobacterium sp.]|uniref:organic hydroperoxide resistance protein n=1 Tax=Sphingobacterium sp. TaxID=341027 RepID=UPI002FDEDD05